MMPTATANSPARHDRVLANLQLHAILPALVPLCGEVPHAADIIRNWNLRLFMGVLGGELSILDFHSGRAHAPGSTEPRPAVYLLAPSHGWLNAMFLSPTPPPPIPFGHPRALLQILGFDALGKVLRAYLEPSCEQLAQPSFQKTHARLTLAVMARAAAVLIREDAECAGLVATHSLATIEFRIEELGQSAWLQVGNAPCFDPSVPLAAKPDARVTFSTVHTFLDAKQAKLDQLAAVGAGAIRVEGSIPLADRMGLVMDRIAHYLPS